MDLLTVERYDFKSDWTIGRLLLNDVKDGFILEGTFRPDGTKIHGRTAIPFGRFYLTLGKALNLVRNIFGVIHKKYSSDQPSEVIFRLSMISDPMYYGYQTYPIFNSFSFIGAIPPLIPMVVCWLEIH